MALTNQDLRTHIKTRYVLGHLRALLVEMSLRRAKAGEQFVLKSGKRSDHYLDVKKTALTAAGHALIGGLLYFIAIDPACRIKLMAGVALGGCPLASAAALTSLRCDAAYLHQWTVDALYVRPEPKDHGTAQDIEGAYVEGDRVILVEDVVTTGGSTLKAISVLQAHGLIVSGVVAVVDREEGGRQAIEAREIPFLALTTYTELLAHAES